MLKNITNFFSKKQKAIQDEIALKSKIDEVLGEFIKDEVLKKRELDYHLSYTVSKGVIRIQIDNKLIAQEIALKIRGLENELKKRGVIFKKLLI